MKKIFLLLFLFIVIQLSGCSQFDISNELSLSSINQPEEIPKVSEPINTPQLEELKEPEILNSEPFDTSNWKIYKEVPFSDMSDHKPWGFEIRYPSGYEQMKGDNLEFPVGSFLKGNSAGGAGAGSFPVSATINILSDEKFSGTDVFYEWLSISYNPDIANVQDCQILDRNGTSNPMVEQIFIGDISWYYLETSAVAAGTSILSNVYHTLHNGMCYEVAQHIAMASKDVGNSSNDAPKVWSDLKDIFSTWKFLNE